MAAVDTRTRESIDSLLQNETVWPNFAQAARFLGIDRSTLTKQAEKGRIAFTARGLGRGEKLIPYSELLRLAGLYRRVAVETVIVNIAHEVAGRLLLDESIIKGSLAALMASTSQSNLVSPLTQKADESTALEVSTRIETREAKAMPITSSARHSIKKLGRLRPRVMSANELPPPSLLEALDSRYHREPQVHIIQKNAKVVKLGRLRPGERVGR